MFKNATLGKRIGMGFAALIVIAVALGGLAVLNMARVRGQARTLANEHIKAWSAANEVERDSLTTMYNMRGYAFTREAKYWDECSKKLQEVETDLAEATKLAQGSRNLAKLKENAEKATTLVQQYNQLAQQTKTYNDQILASRDEMNKTAKAWSDMAYSYLGNQASKQKEELASGMTGAAAVQRADKVTIANDIIDLGNAIRLAAWKSLASGDESIGEKALPNFEAMNKKFAALRAVTTQPANLKQIESCQKAAEDYRKAMTALLTASKALEEVGAQRGQLAEQVLQAAEETAKASQSDANRIATGASTSLGTATLVMILGLIAAVVIGVFLAIGMTRGITGPLFKVIDGLGRGSEQVSSAAGQVSSASQSLAEGASDQASSLEETSAALEEMSSMTQQNADNSRRASAMAVEARDAAEQGNEAMVRMSEAIERIKDSSDQTAKILKTIDEIAFQTNLLALNAAVEAARAGEAGKGFAVVAEEVRNLAHRSAEAAKSTATLIEQSQHEADNGVTATSQVGDILQHIVGKAKSVADLLAEVAAGSSEQAQGIGQVNQAVNQMDTVTQSNASNAEEAAAASEELSAQAREMKDMVQLLVDMVGGDGARGGQSPSEVRSPARPAHRPPLAKGQANSQVNGHSHAVNALSEADLMEF